jgi:hypothetical protein
MYFGDFLYRYIGRQVYRIENIKSLLPISPRCTNIYRKDPVHFLETVADETEFKQIPVFKVFFRI